MTASTVQAVIAGSRGFALSLLVPLAERLGSRPRVVSHPAQVPGLAEREALVVVEFQGEESLQAIQDLVLLQGGSLRIVAAVADAHEAALAPLRALGVEPVRWTGRLDDVLGAVSRRLATPSSRGASAARAPQAVKPAVAQPLPRPPQPAVAPPRPQTAKAGAAPQRVSRPAAPAPAPTPPAPSAPPPDPAATPFEDLLADMRARASAPAPSSSPRPGEGLFDGLGVGAEMAREPEAHDVALDALRAPPPAPGAGEAASGPWPTNIPGAVEAADALGRGLADAFDPPGSPLACVAEVLENLSNVERAVLSGEPQPVDTDPIRRAAVMRVRVAAALAAAPRPGAQIDAGAVSALLAEIDGLLSEVNALAAGAPPELQPSLEAVRNALVKEAIDFSEAAQRGTTTGEAEAGTRPAAGAARARVGRTRVLSETRKEDRADRRRRTLAILLAISVAVAAAFHGWRFLTGSREVPGRPTLPLAPAGTIASDPGKGGSQLLVNPGGKMDAAALRALQERQGLKGNEVVEIAPGVVVVKPAAPASGGK